MPKIKKILEPATPVGTVAELFAGVGGFRIGLAASGWKTVFSNQWEPSTKTQHASDVYVANFGAEGHSNEDIATVENIPNVDLLVGGFPCQDYSVAKSLNSSKGLAGKKGVLWWEILRLVAKKKPKFLFLENVDRLLKSPSSQRGRDFAVMLKTLGDEGYLIEWRVVSASDYGFPQRRIRVFIVAKRTKEKPVKIDNYLMKDGILARALPVSVSYESLSEIDLSDSADVISKNFNKGAGKSPFLNSGVYFGGRAFTAKTTASHKGKKVVLGDVVQPDDEVPSEYFVAADRIKEWEYLKGAKTIERLHKASGTAYNYAEGKMAFPDLLTNPSRTILTGEGGTSPSRFKHIIKTKRGFRRLTPVELERLNGFPDNWTSVGTDGHPVSDVRRAFFMGNALVVGLISRVGKVIAEEFRHSGDKPIHKSKVSEASHTLGKVKTK
jgi:DNA (cytosine-5)-methyltransferase 1